MFEKLDTDLEAVIRRKKRKKTNKEKDADKEQLDDGNLVASNVFWPQNDRKR